MMWKFPMKNNGISKGLLKKMGGWDWILHDGPPRNATRSWRAIGSGKVPDEDWCSCASVPPAAELGDCCEGIHVPIPKKGMYMELILNGYTVIQLVDSMIKHRVN